MPATIAPGVYWNEVDLSNYIPNLSDTIAGLVGTASRGPIGERTFISSIPQLLEQFGPPSAAHYAIYAAIEHLKIGRRLWFTRVQAAATAAVTASVANTMTIAGAAYDLEARDAGTFYNNLLIDIEHTLPLNATPVEAEGDASAVEFTGTLAGGPIRKRSVMVTVGGTLVARDDGEGGLEDVVDGTLDADGNSSINYLTGAVVVDFETAPAAMAEIVVSAEAYSAFTLTVSRMVGGIKRQLDELTNMVLEESHNNYFRPLFEASQYLAAPTTLAAFPQELTDAPMVNGTDGTTGIVDADYIGTVAEDGTQTGLQTFRFAEYVDVNAIACPGIHSQAVRGELITIAEARRDTLVLPDPPPNISVQQVVDWANGVGAYAEYNAVNTTYAALYYPWLFISDPYNPGTEPLIPPSGFAMAAFALTDQNGNPWDSSAGARFGRLQGVLRTNRPLTRGDQALLQQNRINPIVDFATYGAMIWGQLTATTVTSKLDRVPTRRFLLRLEKSVVTAMHPFVFQALTPTLYAAARNAAQPVVQGYVSQGGLEAAEVVIDGRNNTPTVRNQNAMAVDIFLIPVGYADRILLNFVILQSGANVQETIVPANQAV